MGAPSPRPSLGLHMASQVTFVGPLGDAHSLADELIVSPPPAPAHAAATATWAAKATALTSSAGVHGAADPGAHRSKATHGEIGHISGLEKGRELH